MSKLTDKKGIWQEPPGSSAGLRPGTWRLSAGLSLTARSTIFLFAVDSLTNATDYGFHLYLGRALVPGDFAVFQTINSITLILATTFAVLQPVVARYAARAGGAEGTGRWHPPGAVFQAFTRAALMFGAMAGAAAFAARYPLAGWFKVPVVAVGLLAAVIPLAALRPVVGGLLQGMERFVAFGLTRLGFSIGRLVFAGALLAAGAGLAGAVATLPLAAGLALLIGLVAVGRSVWRTRSDALGEIVKDGWRLSVHALVAYAAFMTLLNLDLIWVNRSFDPGVAGSYASLVLLRRVLLLLPGAVLVVMYPRAVALSAQKASPDGLLARSAGVILLSTLALTALYFAFAESIVRLAFGAGYIAAAPLLGWMGLAMAGYGLASVWMNFYLATRPSTYVLLMAAAALLQAGLLYRFHASLGQIVSVFSLGGWLLAIGGGALYFGWHRPTLQGLPERA